MRLFSGGDQYRMGVRIGAAFKAQIQVDCTATRQHPPPLRSTICSEHLLVASRLLDQDFPQVLAEIQGIADGAGVRLLDLLLSLYEELWDSEDQDTGCTDIVANHVGSLNGGLLLGHNNDAGCEAAPPVLLRLAPEGATIVTGVALGGVGLSVGCNEHGLVVTGNQVTASDVKPGIPRILLVRAALNQKTLPDAQAVLLHPHRASSYNTILGDESGRVVSIEGSADKARLLFPTTKGILTHANHYLHPGMEEVEAKGDMYSTQVREQRACSLMTDLAGKHTAQTFQAILRDHAGYPESLCRHAFDTATGFSVVWEAERRTLWYLEGHPCKGIYRPMRY